MPMYKLTGDEPVAFIKGVFDCAAGVPKRNNPYPGNTKESEDWCEGWLEEWYLDDD